MNGEMIKRYWHIPVLIIAAILSLKLRILNPWDSVFTWTVRLGGNDPWYYYRLIENAIHNFPSRIWFDPFTYYPFGSYTHFGPFLVYLSSIAGIITGSLEGERLRAVISFIPAIGGTLTIIPTYLLAREVFDKRTAAIAAFLVIIIPGQFLQRSILGFNDHHVWETFWQVASLGTFLLAYNRWKGRDLRSNLKPKQLLYPISAGICVGLYILTWAPGFIIAPIMLGIIFIALILRLETDFKNLTAMSSVAFLSASVVYLPFSFAYPAMSTVYYSPFQLLILLSSAIISGILFQLCRFDERKIFEKLGLGNLGLQLAALGFAAVIFAATMLIFPEFAGMLASVVAVVQPKGGMLTVAEVYPFFFTHSGEFTLLNALLHFGSLFFFGMIGMAYAAYRILRGRKFNEAAVFIWALAMLVALWGQNRFAYYFAAVVAVYSALLLSTIFEKLHLYKAIAGEKKFSYLRVAIAVLIAIVAVYPTYSFAEAQSKYTGGPNKQWFDTLLWMRENLPDGEKYDSYYLELYPTPKSNSEPYSYPFSTYGVMSWWDYGHWIQSVAHRMPIANPFQAGIGNKYENIPGASSFFTAENESYAEWVAEKLNVRYVVSDIEMETGKFYAMAVWAEGDLPLAEKYYGGYLYYTQAGIGYAASLWDIPLNSVVIPLRVPSELYYRTMEARLHLFDGSGLSHYRMIFESDYPDEWRSYSAQVDLGNESQVLNVALYEALFRARYGVSPTMGTQEVLYKYAYNILYADTPLKISPSGYVKVFERVKGAVVKGKVSQDVEFVTINATIKTNLNRIFEYWQKVKVENGSYVAILPYSHDSGYPVKPVTPYYLRAGDVVRELYLSEDQIQGKEIQLDL